MSPSIEPFNEAKYKALMDGLECSEIRFSKLFSDSNILRLDSNFYSKDIIKYSNIISSKKNYCLNSAINILTDYTANGSFADLAQNVFVTDEKNHAKWVRIQNLESDDYDSNIRYVDEKGYEFLSKSKLFGNELLVSKTGEYLGKAFIFNPTTNDKFTLADNIFLLKLKPGYSKEFIYAYINSRIGRILLLKWSQGTGQPTVIKDSIRSLLVPSFKEEFISLITKCIIEKDNRLKQAIKKYNTATDLLQRKIKFNANNNTNYTTQNFKEIFATNRLDAEYYQSKYDELFLLLENFKTRTLGGYKGLVKIDKSIEPGSNAYTNKGIPFIRVSDINKYEISSPQIKVSKKILPSIENLYPKKDTILLSKDGSVGIAYKVEKDMEAITSSALLHLTVKDPSIILPDYLTLVLNSPIVKLQSERDCNGAILQHWKPSDIEKVLIPILDMPTQQEIASNVQESFHLREESKKLLNLAIKAIEIAIEQNEEIALNWLNEQIK